MARFKEAEQRFMVNVFVCRKCKATNRPKSRRKPTKCRKCGSKDLRPKRRSRGKKA